MQDTTDENETSGAVDHGYDEALKSFREDTDEELVSLGGVDIRDFRPDERIEIAIDLVTRQPLAVIGVTSETVAEHYEKTGFNLLTYKGHPYLPVREDDKVLKCAFISGDPNDVHTNTNTYDYPRGRLVRFPIPEMPEDSE